tara:strand:- start:31 stop:363 length:333 start_codon:yes stop_codon:yes gene_type:complete
MNSYKTIAEEYFYCFSSKNIQSLKNMFHKNITLRDWDISASGIENVIKENKNIFDNVNTIFVKPINLIGENKTIVAELEITINSKDLLKVVDIIDFDDEGKILSIKAFKG